MFDEKYERYWDNLDIDDEWIKKLNIEYENMKSERNTYYRHTRSLENMSEELVYKLSDKKFIQDEIDELSDGNETIKGVSIKKLRAAVETLTDKQKFVLELYIFRGYKQKQIAEIMNISQGNVSELITRALEKMQKKINK